MDVDPIFAYDASAIVLMGFSMDEHKIADFENNTQFNRLPHYSHHCKLWTESKFPQLRATNQKSNWTNCVNSNEAPSGNASLEFLSSKVITGRSSSMQQLFIFDLEILEQHDKGLVKEEGLLKMWY